MYDYMEALKKDVKSYINENLDDLDFSDRDELEASLNDELFNDDSVTGNASGSYTFNRYTARDYVMDNMDLLNDMAREYGVSDEEIGRKFLDEDFEYFDVLIRNYLLSSAISEVLDEMEEDGTIGG